MPDEQSTGHSEIAALAQRVATARGKLPLQHDTALVEVLSDSEIAAERELAEWIRAQRRGQRKRAVRAELSAERRDRRAAARLRRAEAADARWHRKALAARRRVANQDARLAQLYRRAEWSSRALIGVVVLGMVWAGVNVQRNLVPDGDMTNPLYWLSYGIEAMISIPIIVIMVTATTAARWGRELPRGKVIFFEVALLGTTIALNCGPHLAAGNLGRAAEYAIAPAMVGVVIWLHAWVAARYAHLIDSIPIVDDTAVPRLRGSVREWEAEPLGYDQSRETGAVPLGHGPTGEPGAAVHRGTGRSESRSDSYAREGAPSHDADGLSRDAVGPAVLHPAAFADAAAPKSVSAQAVPPRPTTDTVAGPDPVSRHDAEEVRRGHASGAKGSDSGRRNALPHNGAAVFAEDDARRISDEVLRADQRAAASEPTPEAAPESPETSTASDTTPTRAAASETDDAEIPPCDGGELATDTPSGGAPDSPFRVTDFVPAPTTREFRIERTPARPHNGHVNGGEPPKRNGHALPSMNSRDTAGGDHAETANRPLVHAVPLSLVTGGLTAATTEGRPNPRPGARGPRTPNGAVAHAYSPAEDNPHSELATASWAEVRNLRPETGHAPTAPTRDTASRPPSGSEHAPADDRTDTTRPRNSGHAPTDDQSDATRQPTFSDLPAQPTEHTPAARPRTPDHAPTDDNVRHPTTTDRPAQPEQLTLEPEPELPRSTEIILATERALTDENDAPDLEPDTAEDEVRLVARAIADQRRSTLPLDQIAEILTLADQSWPTPGIAKEVGVSTSAVTRVIEAAHKIGRPYADLP
ncbi:hypothetical protein [Nocardia puris]|uniref:Uncharacterized protein n=2 Tax=Nocardia puris TaxID=208602 RepID=A0A366DFW4_9NOCA|nr:hypothetical protein [Nocardia puris]RBO88970.1 hypothetical protein DFR74_108195 [Nocardia puris]